MSRVGCAVPAAQLYVRRFAASDQRAGVASGRARWAAPAATVGLALAVRLLHLIFSAKVQLVDDAVFFEAHARQFSAAWAARGTPQFAPALRSAVDDASLQGVLYPLFQSVVYGVSGGVHHTALVAVQALLGTLTVWLTYLTAQRAFGRVAALVAGMLLALYPPLVISTGLLLAEALLTFVQALALYLVVRGLEPGSWRARLLGGACVGLLMLRPAFQYAGPLLLLALLAAGAGSAPPGERLRSGLRLAGPFAAGVLVVALPWITMNGLVFGSFVWSRTGDAWQQVYWGIYPPNRGWWPPDSPVPPKYGVESLPAAWAAGATIQTRDLDYLEAMLNQVRATPLKALGTEVNKLYQAYLHPFDAYAEHPALVGPLAVPLHRLLLLLALVGLSLGWLRPGSTIVLAAALLASALPFLASHIDVRYTIPPSQAAAPFAGLAVAQLVASRARDRGPSRATRLRLLWLPLLSLAAPFAAWALGIPWLVALAPALAPWHAHLIQTALMCLALVAAGLGGGWILAHGGAPAPRFIASGLAVGGALAALYGIQAAYDGDWHQWTVLLRPGDALRQTLVLPADWHPPSGSRLELRLYFAGSPSQGYEPVVRVNGQEVQRFGSGPKFTGAGPLKFWERIMVAARNQGKGRIEVPQWFGVPLDPALSETERVEVELAIEPHDSPRSGRGWARVWGDYPARPGVRVYEGPPVFSRVPGADVAYLKFVATGDYGIWRWTPLLSPAAEPAWHHGSLWRSDNLSGAPGRHTGEYRIRLLVFGPSGDLVALF